MTKDATLLSPVELARLISAIERREEPDPSHGGLLRPRPQARVVGITGPSGAGKSTLVDGLVTLYRKDAERVAVLAVDPSSPVTGGAVLGDRIRMGRHAVDDGVFIRSMGSRGRTDGLAMPVRDSCRVLTAAGYDPVLVETVGVGQTEQGVVECCDVRVLVLAPLWGDYVQAAKAGLIEMVDLIVVNKADLPGADALVQVVSSVASEGAGGVEAAREAVDEVWDALSSTGLPQRRIEAAMAELLNRVQSAFEAGPLQRATNDGATQRLAEAVCGGETSAAEAAAELFREALGTASRDLGGSGSG
jgi:LAO/AO transport system kinase